MIDCGCKLATWKCQKPRRHARGKQPGRHMHEYTEYTAYVPTDVLLYLRCICLKLVTTELWCLGWPIGPDTGCVADVQGRKKRFSKKHTAAAAAAWNVWLKWQKRHSWFLSSQSHLRTFQTKNSILRPDGVPSQGWVSAVLGKSKLPASSSSWNGSREQAPSNFNFSQTAQHK